MKKKITVLGSFVVDLMSYTPHIPVRGETVKGGPFKAGAGGKGSNQAIAAHKLGAEVTMITKVGMDSFADFAWKAYKDCGMKTDYVYIDKVNSTGTALIIVEEKSAQNIIVVSPGACQNITIEEINNAKNEIIHSDIFLTQLETNIDVVYHAVNIAWENNVKVVLNPAPVQPIDDTLYKKIYALTPNETEAAALSGIKTDNMDGIIKAAAFFREKGVKLVIITLGDKGAYISSDEFEGNLGVISVGKVLDTTGAGDAFSGGLAVALSEGKNIKEAAIFSSIVAGISVTRVGTAPSMPTRDEVETVLKNIKTEM